VILPGLVYLLPKVAATLPSPTHASLKGLCCCKINLVSNFMLAEEIDQSE